MAGHQIFGLNYPPGEETPNTHQTLCSQFRLIADHTARVVDQRDAANRYREECIDILHSRNL